MTLYILCHEARLCELFPDAALTFLDIVIDDTAEWPPDNLKDYLDQISATNPALVDDARFQRLTKFTRQHGEA